MTAVAVPAPPKFSPSTGNSIIEDIILYGRRMQASDLNIGVGSKATMEVYGRVWDIDLGDYEITQSDVMGFLENVLHEMEMERVRGPVGNADGAFRDPQNGNVRVSAYRSRNSLRLALRLLNKDIPKFDELGLPEVVKSFVNFQSGIVLVTGKTGSGKTSTLASLIDIINREQNHHIYTLEDPIEYEHPYYPNSIISQREVGRDVISYTEGLRSMLRAAPHVMMFAEMRDMESVTAALQASSSGHLVFATLHTSEATETVQRIINYFPAEQHTNVRFQLAQALRAAVSQRLIPRKDGRGRVVACEILVNTKQVSAQLEDADKIKQLRNTIQTGKNLKMQLLEENLKQLIAKNIITEADAKLATNYPDQLDLTSSNQL